MPGHLLHCGPLIQVSTIYSLICFIFQQPDVGSKITKKWASFHLLLSSWSVVFGQSFDLSMGSESGNRFHSGNKFSLVLLYPPSFIILFSSSVNFEDPKYFFPVDMGVFLWLCLLVGLHNHMTHSSIHLDASQKIVLVNEISVLN